MTTASGAAYELTVDFGKGGNSYAKDTVLPTLAANWVTAPALNYWGVKIYGVRNKDGTTDTVKALTVTNKLQKGEGLMPTVTGTDGVKVEVKTDDGNGKPDPARKVPPKGPKIPDETFVEFDLSTLPPGADKVYWKLTWEVRTTAGKEEPRFQLTMEVLSDGAAGHIPASLARSLPEAAFKAEVVEKTKVRVYGGVYQGRYYPAEQGSITSPHLKPNQLPKITNPKRL